MKIVLLVASLRLAGANAAVAQAAVWECANKPESAYLAEAPLGATRVGTDQLTITTAKGPLVFRDSGVVAGEPSGTQYRYCGYRAGFHLLRKNDELLYTGLLISQSTGKVLPAGHQVMFSPSNSAYLAVVQPDGQDGETWEVYTASGTPIWKGYAGLVGRVPKFDFDMVLGELHDPRWTPSGELTATFFCKEHRSNVTLKKGPAGWNWAPRLKCVQPE